MRISTQSKILLGGAVTALLIFVAGQMTARNMESKSNALENDPRLRALASECKSAGGFYDAAAKHFQGTNQDGTPIQLNATCNEFLRLWDQIEPWSEPSAVKPGQPKAWAQYAVDWALPGAAFVLAFSALPWLWYFLLRRIQELRDAIAGK